MAELAGLRGFRTHRSWWVAAEAIDEVTWLRGRGEAKLKCGMTVPISRSNAQPLKAAGPVGPAAPEMSPDLSS